MSDLGEQIIYRKFVERHTAIRIPILQRDYAQGRQGQEEVRDRFLETLQEALDLPADDASLPRNLDFIYGSVQGDVGKTSFSPLDGQQRLTTLFLLHWYLAWNDNRWQNFQSLFEHDGHARFSYSVRTTSTEFFDKLVIHPPDLRPGNVPSLRDWITDQPWFSRYWRFDPTIISALNMLQAMHARFVGKQGLYARLTDEVHPAITFQLLDLKHFGLSDDLYIKMNARGKPLTAFETFKARYEQELEKQFCGGTRSIGNEQFSVADFVSRRMDTAWADFFWAHREKDSTVYDDAVMNLFRVVALVSRNPQSPAFGKDATLLRDAATPLTFPIFQKNAWLDEDFSRLLISLMEVWSATDAFARPALADRRYFDEKQFFLRLISYPTNLTASEVVLFTGYALFIQQHEAEIDPVAFGEWMRVVHNLAVNSDIDRTALLQGAFRAVRELLPKATEILPHLASLGPKDRISGFVEQQVKEESLKAGLILADAGWRSLIERAENHGYFRGQVEFLCDFSGVMEQWTPGGDKLAWDATTHRRLQERFESYLLKAEAMFNAHGLTKLGDLRWQRALLSIGDYLLPAGLNKSFLVDSAANLASWKRFLRGTAPNHPEKRPLLRQLWDRLVTDRPFAEQLDELIGKASGLEPWIEAFVRTPHPMAYCERQLIRWHSPTEIFLLSTSQMNGAHAELFTYCLEHSVVRSMQKNGTLNPLKVGQYYTPITKDETPYIRLNFHYRGHGLVFWVQFTYGRYLIGINRDALDPFPEIQNLLGTTGGFANHGETLCRATTLDAIEAALTELAAFLAALPARLP